MTNRNFVRALIVGVVLFTVGFVISARRSVSQTQPPLTGIQFARPVKFIYPSELHFGANNTITYLPAHGMVRIYAFNGTTYVPTSTVVPVDNLFPGISLGILQPVWIEQINSRWVVVATTP